jgi:6-phosphogluconolactonase
MNLSKKNLPANLPVLAFLVLCGVSLLLAGCKKSSTTPNYSVSVTTSGLVGSGVVVQLNGAYNLTIPASGISTFPTQFPNDSAYGITILKQPTLPPQTCVMGNATGTINSANVTNVTMTCGPIEFAYLTNSLANSITQLVIDKTTGALAQNSGPVPTGANPAAFALDQTGRYAFVVNKTGETISPYLANSTLGLLVSAGTAPNTGTTPTAVAIDPSSQYVYVANNGGANVTGYSITASTGAINCVDPSVSGCLATASVGTSPSALAFAKQNGTEYLYVANSGSNSISQFTVDLANGTLSPLAAPATTGNTPSALAVTGAFAYALNSADSTISSYKIISGALNVNGAAVSSGGSGPSAIAISPNGLYAYVTNASANTISAFSIGSTGLLNILGTPLSTVGSQPVSVSVDPQGLFVFVANKTDGSVSTYQIGTGGSLTLVSNQLWGNGPVSFATAPN